MCGRGALRRQGRMQSSQKACSQMATYQKATYQKATSPPCAPFADSAMTFMKW